MKEPTLVLFSVRLFTMLGLLYPCLVPSQDAPLKRKDFSHTNSVSILMVESGRGRDIVDHGLRHPIRAGGDAQTAFMDVEGVPCGCLDPTVERNPKAYLPFRIDPAFKNQEVGNVRIDVDLF